MSVVQNVGIILKRELIMKVYNSAKREKVVNIILQWFIGFGILFIMVKIGEILKMMIWGI